MFNIKRNSTEGVQGVVNSQIIILKTSMSVNLLSIDFMFFLALKHSLFWLPLNSKNEELEKHEVIDFFLFGRPLGIEQLKSLTTYP